MDKNIAQSLLKKSKEDYCKIAKSFSQTRQWIWPELLEYLNSSKEGEKILDFGCGNGRLFDYLKYKEINYTGLDNCENFINIAKEKYKKEKASFLVGDVLNAPFPNASFDKIFSIAVLHHIPSKEKRRQFFGEIKRLLKKDGIAVVTVWNLYQRRYFSYYVKSIINKLFCKGGGLDFGDVFIPWKEGQEIPIQRYVHAFSKRELFQLAKSAGLDVQECKHSFRNKKKTNLILVLKNGRI